MSELKHCCACFLSLEKKLKTPMVEKTTSSVLARATEAKSARIAIATRLEFNDVVESSDAAAAAANSNSTNTKSTKRSAQMADISVV